MKPLEGLRVVELAQNLAGPFCGEILGALGAEVVKIERPDGGDDVRGWGPPFHEGAGTAFHALNLGKKSVTLDLKDPESFAWLLDFIGESDIVLHNMRPGVMKELSLDGETLTARFPHLIYVEISGYGATGPMASSLGYDTIVQAVTGFFHLNGDPDGKPSRVGPSVLDMGSGMWGVIGVLSALRIREKTGKGAIIDTSLMETALSYIAPAIANYSLAKTPPPRLRAGIMKVVPFEAFPTSDGEIIVAAANDRLFRRLMVTLGLNAMAEDERFRHNKDRAANKAELIEAIRAVLSTQTTGYWLEALTKASIPCGPVNTLPQALDHPQTQALGMIRECANSGLKLTSLPIRFDRQRVSIDGDAPALGVDTDANVRTDAQRRAQASND